MTKRKTQPAAPIICKEELVHQIASRAGTTLKNVESTLDAFIKVVQEDLAKGCSVRLMGFGTWEVRPVAARNFRPINSDRLDTLPARHRVGFQVGAVLAKAASEK